MRSATEVPTCMLPKTMSRPNSSYELQMHGWVALRQFKCEAVPGWWHAVHTPAPSTHEPVPVQAYQQQTTIYPLGVGRQAVHGPRSGASQAERRCSNTTQPQRLTSIRNPSRRRHMHKLSDTCKGPVHNTHCCRTQPQENEWSAHLGTGANCSAGPGC